MCIKMLHLENIHLFWSLTPNTSRTNNLFEALNLDGCVYRWLISMNRNEDATADSAMPVKLSKRREALSFHAMNRIADYKGTIS